MDEDVGKDLSRDVSSLRAVLESEDEDERPLEESTNFGESSGTQQNAHSTVLEKLKVCLQENLKLQNELHVLLHATKISLNTNRYDQTRLDILMKQTRRFPRSSICTYLRASKPSKSKSPYFMDYKMEAPPPNNDSLQLARLYTVPDFYFASSEWVAADCAKLKAGVKQKNMELLSQPIKKEMSKSDITMSELKALETKIRELRNQDKALLLKYSPEIDWDSLAYEHFGTERSGIDCHLRHRNHDQPSISRSAWKREEEKRLMRLAKANNLRNWEKIARELNTNRSAIQCMSHYQKALNPEFLNRVWTKEEDKKMQEAVKIYGQNWGLVATYIGNRTSVQCTNRNHALWNRQYKSGRWTEEEDKLLHEAIDKYGDVGIIWPKIAGYVQSRTSTQCRERWRTVVMGKTLLRPWTNSETDRIIEYGRKQLENGESMQWAKLGRELNRRDDDCRRHWMIKASSEDLIKYKTLVVKSQSCIKSKRTSVRTDNAMNEPTVQPKDLEDDMMPEKAKKELSDYQDALNKKGKPKPPEDKPKRKPKKKRKGVPQSSNMMTAQAPVIIPIPPSLWPYYYPGGLPSPLNMPSTLPQLISPLTASMFTFPHNLPFQSLGYQLPFSLNSNTSNVSTITSTTTVTPATSSASNSCSGISVMPSSQRSSSEVPVSAESSNHCQDSQQSQDQGPVVSRESAVQSKKRRIH